MTVTYAFIAIYAFLMLAGGVIGYRKASSKMSLIMGVASFIIIFIGLYIAQINTHLGYMIITVMSSVLVIVFIIRFNKTRRFMPSGMLAAVSAVAVWLSCLQLF